MSPQTIGTKVLELLARVGEPLRNKSFGIVVEESGTKVLEPLGRVGEPLWNKSFGTVGTKVLEPLARVG